VVSAYRRGDKKPGFLLGVLIGTDLDPALNETFMRVQRFAAT
jgi:hypothetical protein